MLQRGTPQESGESTAGPEPQKLSSIAKANQKAPSISRDGIRAQLGSDLRKQPIVAESVFYGKRLSWTFERSLP